MLNTLKEFWRDDSGLSRLTVLLVEAAAGIAVTAVILTTVFVGMRNNSVKLKQEIENAAP